MPGYANPQNLNRYSYVTNNPLRYTDPTGHKACDDIDRNGKCITAPGGGGSGFGGLQPKEDEDEDDNEPSSPENSSTFEVSTSGFGIYSSWDAFWDGQYTPLYFAVAQEFFAGTQEAGEWMVAFAFSTENPVLAIVGGGVYVASWALGRVSGGLGTYTTIRQYYKNLNGTNGTDVYVSIGTTVAGTYAPLSAKSSTVNLLYTAYRTAGGSVPEILFLPRK